MKSVIMKINGKAKSIEESKKGKGDITIKGWIYRKRSSGGKIFAVIHDHTGTLQCIIDRSHLSADKWDSIEKAYLESSIIVKGTLRKDERAPGGVEMDVKDLEVVHSGEQFPITEYQSAEFLLDVRHLWLRSQKMTSIMRARSYIFKYSREYLDKNGFYEITPPLITNVAGETGADMFDVDYFGQKAYLTESSQFYAEAMIPALHKVYSFSPSFRAEKSRTIKHLAEYWHLEPEAAYHDWKMNMNLAESLVSHIADRVAKKNEDILNVLNVDKEDLLKVKPPFKRITYEKALKILNEKGVKLEWGDDFGVEEERLLTEDEDKPIFVYWFPKELKPFYAPVNPKDKRTVLAADMLAPHGHGEIVGSSERIWRMDELLERIKEVEAAKGIKINLDNYKWYIDLRRYGSVPHSGFGMGMERIIKWMLNLDHIRDAIPFPRMMNRIYP
jgi:asparaginyl-tRNA synthetase